MCSQQTVRIELQHEAVIHLKLLMQILKHLCLNRNRVQRGAHRSLMVAPSAILRCAWMKRLLTFQLVDISSGLL